MGTPVDAAVAKVALVTGASRGIGKAAALLLAEKGFRVVLADISGEGLETAEAIGASGGEALFVHVDVSDPLSVDRLHARVHNEWGPVDLLINNAIISPAAPVVDMTVAQWDRVMAVNLRGAFLATRSVLPEMLDRGSGTIVNMVSADVMPYASAYIASKRGLEGFSASLAAEVEARGVTVLAFAPGMVDTEGLRETLEALGREAGIDLDPALQTSLSPEQAAGVLVDLVLRYADEYHGETVDAYTIVERRKAEGAPVAAPTGNQAGSSRKEPGHAIEVAETGAAQARALADMMGEAEAEFNQLNFFIRPLARRALQSRSGKSATEWQRTAVNLATRLRDEPAAALPSEYVTDLRSGLGRLMEYIEAVPRETARFTSDTEFLAQVERTTRLRVSTLQSLLGILDQLDTSQEASLSRPF